MARLVMCYLQEFGEKDERETHTRPDSVRQPVTSHDTRVIRWRRGRVQHGLLTSVDAVHMLRWSAEYKARLSIRGIYPTDVSGSQPFRRQPQGGLIDNSDQLNNLTDGTDWFLFFNFKNGKKTLLERSVRPTNIGILWNCEGGWCVWGFVGAAADPGEAAVCYFVPGPLRGPSAAALSDGPSL